MYSSTPAPIWQHNTNLQAQNYNIFRKLTAGILSASRYFATVRRAITMPCSPSISAILLSESGLFLFSAPINCLMSALIAVEEASPPARSEERRVGKEC